MNAATLYELLDRLPKRCDDFTVRFTLRDRAVWFQPDSWEIDDDNDVLFESIYSL